MTGQKWLTDCSHDEKMEKEMGRPWVDSLSIGRRKGSLDLKSNDNSIVGCEADASLTYFPSKDYRIALRFLF